MKTKPPHQLTSGLYRFPPNRDTLGGTAYLLTLKQGDSVLIDSPPWNDHIQGWLATRGTIRWLCLTHRGGHSPQLKAIQAQLGCQIIVQEQEAYLLPHLNACQFREALNITEDLTAVWTPGHSPGSSCYYRKGQGGHIIHRSSLSSHSRTTFGSATDPQNLSLAASAKQCKKITKNNGRQKLSSHLPRGEPRISQGERMADGFPP